MGDEIAPEGDSKGLKDVGLHGTEDSGALHGAPESEEPVTQDPKAALLEALRNVDRETLLAVLAEALTGKALGE